MRNATTQNPLLWLLLLLTAWACLAVLYTGPKTASGQNSGLESASTEFALWQAAPHLGFSGLAEKVAAVPLVGAKGGAGATTAEEYVNILSPAERQHILFGDGPGSGGHMYPGQPGKTTFPQNWTEGQILYNVGDVVTSPTTQWYAQTGTGGALTKAGDPAKWVAWETRDGVSMRVVYEPATGRTVTAFPDSAPTTINLKPISK